MFRGPGGPLGMVISKGKWMMIIVRGAYGRPEWQAVFSYAQLSKEETAELGYPGRIHGEGLLTNKGKAPGGVREARVRRKGFWGG
jgi:hypothetical protein